MKLRMDFRHFERVFLFSKRQKKTFFKEFFFFLMWTIFKVFFEFFTGLLLFCVLGFWPQGMWDLSCPVRDRTCTPCKKMKS